MTRTRTIEYEVGMKLWFQGERRYNKSGVVTVDKVGRKWVELSNGYRVLKNSVHVDGGDYLSPGMLYLSKEECDKEQAENRAWSDLLYEMRNLNWRPEGMTLEKINQIKELLGGTK